jgi:hypothetical protein
MPVSDQLLIVLFTALVSGTVVFFIMRDRQYKRIVAINQERRQELLMVGRINEGKVQSAIAEERKANQIRIRDLERHWQDRLESQSKLSLSVVLYPFVNTVAERGMFTRESKVEVGYKYQLLVQGLPCFEPHVVVVETTQHKEINEEMIDLLKSKAAEFAQAAVEAKGGFPGAIFSVAKAVAQRVR